MFSLRTNHQHRHYYLMMMPIDLRCLVNSNCFVSAFYQFYCLSEMVFYVQFIVCILDCCFLHLDILTVSVRLHVNECDWNTLTCLTCHSVTYRIRTQMRCIYTKMLLIQVLYRPVVRSRVVFHIMACLEHLM